MRVQQWRLGSQAHRRRATAVMLRAVAAGVAPAAAAWAPWAAPRMSHRPRTRRTPRRPPPRPTPPGCWTATYRGDGDFWRQNMPQLAEDSIRCDHCRLTLGPAALAQPAAFCLLLLSESCSFWVRCADVQKSVQRHLRRVAPGRWLVRAGAAGLAASAAPPPLAPCAKASGKRRIASWIL